MAGATWNCYRLGILFRVHHMTMHHVSHHFMPCHFMPCHFMQSHICRVHVYLAVTCHLHFWQKDQDLFIATGSTAVKRGSNRYQNKSQHKKLTIEKKILQLFLSVVCPRSLPVILSWRWIHFSLLKKKKICPNDYTKRPHAAAKQIQVRHTCLEDSSVTK